MDLLMRPYQGEEDYWRVREFLRKVLLLNNRRERSWDLSRWDYWRWHVNENIFQLPLEENVFLWEAPDGQMAAALNPENKGEAFFQVHPGYRSQELESEILAIAEARLATATENNRRRLQVWANQDDPLRQELFKKHGYLKGESPEYQRRRPMNLPVPDAPVAEGYTVRALGSRAELPARSLVSFRAFHPGEPETGHDDPAWYLNVQRAPLYRRDLDIVAVSPDGEFAAFCTVWFDDVTRTGRFEPVGTDPAHQRRGLGKAVMCEGLRRLQRKGATLAYVGSYSTPAHQLYASVGFNDYDLLERWEKEW